EDFKDALTMGYTPSLAVGVWVGNNDNAAMDSVAGSLGAAPIWKDLMEKFLANKPAEAFAMPEGIVQAPICANGLLASASWPGTQTEYFISGTQPSAYCTRSLPKPSPNTFSAGQNQNSDNKNEALKNQLQQVQGASEQ